MKKEIGFAGLGTMGSSMSANLLRHGFPVRVWDRKAEAVEALVAVGASAASSPETLAHDADVVISILWGDDASREVVLERMIPAARPATTFLEMSTVSAAMQHTLGRAAEERHCKFLGAPVTGSKDAAAAGELTALVGGPREVLDEQRDVLDAMAKTVLYVGGYGSSAALKLGNNQLLGLVIAGIGESLRATDAAGVDRNVALTLFAATAGRVAEMKRKPIAEHDFSPHFTLAALVKDLRSACDAATELGLELPLLVQTCAVYERALAAGKGSLDFSAITDSSP
jgi:3-hydroxyisobutyrate dehydrogenase-like beta-hydroxyacid dehydrogenase